MATHKHTNRLIHESSPYLLQHAHNPVDWYPWGEEAFDKAERENKPILVSIGYSTCHWCHVMERESFEDERVAKYMNEYFVNIKIDREERPDIDQIYMEAVQAMSGSGGWPLNCFLTPDKKPFYGGTYFPPKSNYGRPSWPQVISRIANAFYNQRDVVDEQADKLVDLIHKSDGHFVNDIEGLKSEEVFTFDLLENTYYKLRDRFDRLEGGFGNAPKFPGSMAIQFLLNYNHFTENEEALFHALFSLDKMIEGGIYDQLGGGFARYATDRAWLIPHFEKMLYDNALLVSVISEAYKMTKRSLYKETLIETLDFVKREMTSEEGGFYSAQDADSEGVEGKYYVWQKSEIEEILGEDAALFTAFYGVSEGGNWEHTNILWREQNYEQFAKQRGMMEADLKEKLSTCRQQLFEIRDKRIKPGLDDKILLDWNALMVKAYAKAYTALGNVEYKNIAERNLAFIFSSFSKNEEGYLYHTYKKGKAQYNAFLNDYAFLIDSLLEVYFITFKEEYLTKAKFYTNLVLEEFFDEADGLFYYTSSQQEDVILRKKDMYDSAVPSGNSTMMHNLQRLGILLGNEYYKTLAKNMLLSLKDSISQYPNSFARWANGLLNETYSIKEIAIVGEEAMAFGKAINELFIPNKVIMATRSDDDKYPLLAGKKATDDTKIFVCKNYSCNLPITSVAEFKKQEMNV